MPTSVLRPALEQDEPALEQDDIESRVYPSASEIVDTAPEEVNQKENADDGNTGDTKKEENPAGDARKAAAEAGEAAAEGSENAGREPHGPRGTGNGTGSETMRKTPRRIAS